MSMNVAVGSSISKTFCWILDVHELRINITSSTTQTIPTLPKLTSAMNFKKEARDQPCCPHVSTLLSIFVATGGDAARQYKIDSRIYFGGYWKILVGLVRQRGRFPSGLHTVNCKNMIYFINTEAVCLNALLPWWYFHSQPCFSSDVPIIMGKKRKRKHLWTKQMRMNWAWC